MFSLRSSLLPHRKFEQLCDTEIKRHNTSRAVRILESFFHSLGGLAVRGQPPKRVHVHVSIFVHVTCMCLCVGMYMCMNMIVLCMFICIYCMTMYSAVRIPSVFNCAIYISIIIIIIIIIIILLLLLLLLLSLKREIQGSFPAVSSLSTDIQPVTLVLPC